ncbi:MAG: GNAT family N-acetyltransferase [Akkermansia sp.]|nr:GNAT family N-acetyltransferase [Akkermansia sp.]
MVDMLVRLYALPEGAPLRRKLEEKGVLIRTCRPYEMHAVQEWIARTFSTRWVSEFTAAMSHQPVGCIIATRNREVLGFACFDATMRGFIGPMGVDPSLRMGGVGKALLVTALEQMKALGYGYAVIGGTGPQEFYSRTVGATVIEGSDPGIYADILPEPS